MSHLRRLDSAACALRPRAFRRPIPLLACVAIVAGCAGGPRPARPDRAAAGDLPLLLAAADSAAARGSATEARSAYTRAARSAKEGRDRALEARAEIGAGLMALALGEAEPARRSLARALESDPSSAAAHVAMGRYFAAIRRYRDAKAEFDRAAALDTLGAEPFYRLGLACVEAGEPTLAAGAFTRALSRDPTYAPARSGLRSVLEERYVAAGLPAGYAALRDHANVSRGELGVMLAAELGVDPDRPGWREGVGDRSEAPDARGAWGERWLRAAMGRGWIGPYPDGSYHLGDPVTRGALALLLAGIETSWPGREREGASSPEPAGAEAHAPEPFPDLGSRHYLFRAAQRARRLGLPLRAEGRFDPWASATGTEIVLALRGLGQALGARPALSEEPGTISVVK